MLLKQIYQNNFRNLERTSYDFSPFLTMIVGKNATGKTNLLEALYFVINGSGFRESKEEELIHLGETAASVESRFILDKEIFGYKINIFKKEKGVEKFFAVNKTKKNFHQYFKEQIKVILFSPQQIEIITGSPEERRSYLNKLISSYDLEYKKSLLNYENALKKRNKILEQFNNKEKLIEELEFWNGYLENQGKYLTEKRSRYINFLNRNQNLEEKEFEVEYIKNEMSKTRLDDFFEKERRWKKTLIGPQKDDFQIYLKNKVSKNLHHYGSRSEQRLAVFWLKTNEIKYYEENFGKKPILLLDDIFSELDKQNKKLVLNLIKKYQIVITTTEVGLIDLIDVPKIIIKL